MRWERTGAGVAGRCGEPPFGVRQMRMALRFVVTDETSRRQRRSPVHHVVVVAVLHARDDLLEEVARLGLGQAPLVHDVIEQLA